LTHTFDHPLTPRPTCLFLAAKTTNHPVPIDVFVSKLQGFKASDVLDLEFLVAQSLGFEFWVRGAEKAVRGWSLELQDQPSPPIDTVQKALSAALDRLHASRYTDAEFLYAPAQIALACWRVANRELVDRFLEDKYTAASDADSLPYGAPLDELRRVIEEVEEVVRDDSGANPELKKIKEVDKRLKACSNPEKIPGTAL
jgi:cyclin H